MSHTVAERNFSRWTSGPPGSVGSANHKTRRVNGQSLFTRSPPPAHLSSSSHLCRGPPDLAIHQDPLHIRTKATYQLGTNRRTAWPSPSQPPKTQLFDRPGANHPSNIVPGSDPFPLVNSAGLSSHSITNPCFQFPKTELVAAETADPFARQPRASG